MTLESTFSFKAFGLEVRLISEEDAPFIVSLRSDRDRTKYMVTIDNDLEKQQQWIYQYKKRERKGEDYYFIYLNSEGDPIGAYRISNINHTVSSCKVSSWIKRPGPDSEALAMFIIHRLIIFKVLKLKRFYSDIHKDNLRALSYYDGFEKCRYKEDENFIYYLIDEETFYRVYQKQIDALTMK
jgi:RimJ/RimL family protein N-acetyltransferase